MLTSVRLLEIREAEAIHEMDWTDGGTTKSFEILFRKDKEGFWRLWMC